MSIKSIQIAFKCKSLIACFFYNIYNFKGLKSIIQKSYNTTVYSLSLLYFKYSYIKSSIFPSITACTFPISQPVL